MRGKEGVVPHCLLKRSDCLSSPINLTNQQGQKRTTHIKKTMKVNAKIEEYPFRRLNVNPFTKHTHCLVTLFLLFQYILFYQMISPDRCDAINLTTLLRIIHNIFPSLVPTLITLKPIYHSTTEKKTNKLRASETPPKHFL